MTDHSSRIKLLFERYINKTASAEEIKEFFKLTTGNQYGAELKELLIKELKNTVVHDDHDNKHWNLVLDKIKAEANVSGINADNSPKRYLSLKRLSVAAAIVLCTAIGLLLFYSKNQEKKEVTYVNNIKPGNNKAYLTLANGKRIDLDDAVKGKLAEQSGVAISKTANGQLVYKILDQSDNKVKDQEPQYNIIETPKGGQHEIQLPDGSKIWLNALSSLKFPTTFKSLNKREVILKGEAYFEVVHNKKVPFIVVTDKQTVEVLGTHFNINSYPDEPTTKTTLLEGSVKVSSLKSQTSKLLIPGQQATLQSDRFSIDEVNVENTIAWKNGFFMFNDEPLDEVMRKISRWYGVDIVFKDFGLEKQSAYGEISKYDQVSEVLDMLEMTGEMHFEITGNKITVTKK